MTLGRLLHCGIFEEQRLHTLMTRFGGNTIGDNQTIDPTAVRNNALIEAGFPTQDGTLHRKYHQQRSSDRFKNQGETTP